MSAPAAFAIVLLVAAITYAMRTGPIVALAGRSIPRPAERALRYVGPAVLAALALNLAAGGEGGPQIELGEAAAMVVAGVIGWRRRDVTQSLVAGMFTLLVVSAIAG